jgi:hypothetical protein
MKFLIDIIILAGYKSILGEPFSSPTISSFAIRVAKTNAINIGVSIIGSVLLGTSLVTAIAVAYITAFISNLAVLLLLNSKYSHIAD